jgi:hypothetical protein
MPKNPFSDEPPGKPSTTKRKSSGDGPVPYPFRDEPPGKPPAPKKQTQYMRKAGDPIHYEDGSSEPDNTGAYQRAASKPLYDGSDGVSRSAKRLLDGLLKDIPKIKGGYLPKDMDR